MGKRIEEIEIFNTKIKVIMDDNLPKNCMFTRQFDGSYTAFVFTQEGLKTLKLTPHVTSTSTQKPGVKTDG